MIHHLTLEDRKIIEESISENKSKKSIAKLLGKDPAGLGHEIKRQREFKARNTWNRPILCALRKNCGQKCTEKCEKFKEPTCYRRDTSPGACNGCEKRGKCPNDKFFYNAVRADAAYRAQLVSCREGINLTGDERNKIGTTIAPLLKQGQSVYQILSKHPELELSERSVYTYIETGVFKDFGVDNFSLKEQVQRKQWSKKYKKRKEPANYKGRSHQDYITFIQQNPEAKVVEMDTVYNSASGPYIQTFIFPELEFMIGRLHGEKTSENMALSLDYYQNKLGFDEFVRLFSLLLTDRGTEFEKFNFFERDKQGNSRLHIFYCDAMQSAQKPHVENNHKYVRDIIPNGIDIGKLTQEDIDLMFSHINSTPRKSLHGKTPYEVFTFYYSAEVAEKLCMVKVECDNVILNPSLVFNKK